MEGSGREAGHGDRFPEGESATLKLTLKSRKDFTLALRRPFWAGEGFSVKVNGEAVKDLPKAGSYVELKRTWKSGDTVTLVLPKTLRLEPLPDNPRRVAIMWGPLVLAGDLGPERKAEGNEAAVPARQSRQCRCSWPPTGRWTKWLKPVADKPGTFRTDGVGRTRTWTSCRSTACTAGPTASTGTCSRPRSGSRRPRPMLAAQEKQRKLEAATVAFVQPGEMQPETDFNYQGEGADVGRVMGASGPPGEAASGSPSTCRWTRPIRWPWS